MNNPTLPGLGMLQQSGQLPANLLNQIAAQVLGPQSQVIFYNKAVPDKEASEKLGRPVSRDEDYVRIVMPADPKSEYHSPANAKTIYSKEAGRYLTYAEKYPAEFAAYKQSNQMVLNGTSLDEAPFLTEAQRANLRSAGIYTVENLAAIDGAALANLGMHARDMKEQAMAYLQSATDSAAATRMAHRLTEMEKRMAYLESELDDKNGIIQNLNETIKHNKVEVRPDVDPDASTAMPEDNTRHPAAEPSPVQQVADEDFSGWKVGELKAFIESETGVKPLGNPDKATLIQMAQEAHRKTWEDAE